MIINVPHLSVIGNHENEPASTTPGNVIVISNLYHPFLFTMIFLIIKGILRKAKLKILIILLNYCSEFMQ